MRIMKNKLLQVATSDGLYLHGYYVPSNDKKVAVLHIHGFEGNFHEDLTRTRWQKKLVSLS